ncbi:A/G-specific adenine glycosylase [Chelativorans sp. YIM 93263]|uniref:A/G-specific adenine glycosylase n=1 Tax=Chelativorans sp. YIM 93263 TaxID=2906648 RepID=UPI002378F3F1|nr:A/G-specific adenine glycosylase [Chelativorans sp. YIM 93263]
MTAERELSEAPGRALLAWYDRHQRQLPWRLSRSEAGQGLHPDPYRVWLSEIMLQQTTVTAVKPYYDKFLAQWPNVEALAAAETDEIMRAWAGLGYYSRARNLKKCADMLVDRHDGEFPNTEAELKKLPGIGDYTAAAIAAIAFGRPAAVVDGNVERVMSRFAGVETPLPAAKPEIKKLVEAILPAERPGDFAQAMMDLGATICTPRRPSCILCPLTGDCIARRQGAQERFPLKAPKAEKPLRRGAAFVAVREDGAVLLRRRPETGLLGGMCEVPTTAWNARQDGREDITAAPFTADWQDCGTARHVFTHFALQLSVYKALVGNDMAAVGGWWSPCDVLHGEALPSVMKKAIETAIPGATKRKREKAAK